MYPKDILPQLSIAIERQQISEDAARALSDIAIDPHGIERTAAPPLIASLLEVSLERANQAIIELLGTGMIIVQERNNQSRLYANYDLLGIDEETRNQLVRHQEPFEDQTEPHSERAMQALEDFFETTDDTIYLGLEVTSHHVFRLLERRAQSGRMTVFLIPRKSEVPQSRRIHYDEVLQGWIKFIQNGSKALKKNTRICITSTPFPELFTSSIGPNFARFDVYFYGSRTTRRGRILQVKKGTSLYDLIYHRYQQALRRSCPHWRIWWWEATFHWIRKLFAPGVLVIIGVLLAGLRNPFGIVGSALAVSILANVISNRLGVVLWIPPELFKK